TLRLPDPWTPQPPTPATFPIFTFDYTGLANQVAVADEGGISWAQTPNGFAIGVISTAHRQSGATTLAIPDLTALPGFLSMPPSGTTTNWGAVTWGGTAQFYVGTTVIPQTISNAAGRGTYTQP